MTFRLIGSVCFIALTGTLFSQTGRVVLDNPEPLPIQFVRFKNQNPKNYLTRDRIGNRLTFGELLFRSPFIYNDRMRKLGLSCQSCHPNGDTNREFFIPNNSGKKGLVDFTHSFFGAEFDNGISDPLVIPTLRGTVFRAPYGHSGGFKSLTGFTRHVIVNRMGGPEPDPEILHALVAYLRELDFLPNGNLDNRGRLSDDAPKAAKEGEKLFHKNYPKLGGSCAGCHIPTAYFTDNRIHRIGSKGNLMGFSFEGGTKTPSLLGGRAGLFFHNGSHDTPEAAVTWFNQEFTLGLDQNQVGSLAAYVKALRYSDIKVDERHISERLVEVISMLKILETEKYWQKYRPLILDSVTFILSKNAKLLKGSKKPVLAALKAISGLRSATDKQAAEKVRLTFQKRLLAVQ